VCARTRALQEYVIISANSKTASEVRLIPAAAPRVRPLVVEPRAAGLRYYVHHCRVRAGVRVGKRCVCDRRTIPMAQGTLFMVTNENAPNFKVRFPPT
jgi:protease II